MTVPVRLPIEARGQLGAREQVDAMREVQRRMGNGWILPTVALGGPTLIVAFTMLVGESLGRALFRNLFWIVLGLLYFFGLPLALRLNLRSFIRANPELGAIQLYRFTETGLELRGGPTEVSVAWPNVTEAVETKEVFLIFTGRTMAQILPRAAFMAAGQLEAVRELLRERLGERAHLLRRPGSLAEDGIVGN